MKKRLIAFALALSCLLALTACGKPEPAAAPFTPDVLTKLSDAGAFSEPLETLEGDILFAIYLLADSGYTLKDMDLDACVGLRSTGATCEEAAVLTFIGLAEDKLAGVEQCLKDYLQAQIDANVNYRPAEIPKLEKAVVERRGNTFLILVANDYEAAKPVIS